MLQFRRRLTFTSHVPNRTDPSRVSQRAGVLQLDINRFKIAENLGRGLGLWQFAVYGGCVRGRRLDRVKVVLPSEGAGTGGWARSTGGGRSRGMGQSERRSAGYPWACHRKRKSLTGRLLVGMASASYWGLMECVTWLVDRRRLTDDGEASSSVCPSLRSDKDQAGVSRRDVTSSTVRRLVRSKWEIDGWHGGSRWCSRELKVSSC